MPSILLERKVNFVHISTAREYSTGNISTLSSERRIILQGVSGMSGSETPGYPRSFVFDSYVELQASSVASGFSPASGVVVT